MVRMVASGRSLVADVGLAAEVAAAGTAAMAEKDDDGETKVNEDDARSTALLSSCSFKANDSDALTLCSSEGLQASSGASMCVISRLGGSNPPSSPSSSSSRSSCRLSSVAP